MFFPLKGDLNFLKNLKKGTPLYICEATWNPSKGQTEMFVKSIFFDHYETDKKVVNGEDDETIMAVLTKNKVSTESHNIAYGFFETPLKALQSMQTLYSEGLKATEKAIKKEENRLKKLVDKMAKKNSNNS